jgi:hypothetical protein
MSYRQVLLMLSVNGGVVKTEGLYHIEKSFQQFRRTYCLKAYQNYFL